MKALAVLYLSCASLFGADISNTNAPDITSKVVERNLEGGKKHLRLETFYRGKAPVVRVLKTTSAGVTKTSRSYLVGGDLVMIESDNDADGWFESVTLLRPGTADLEMFTRKSDGLVKPVSTATLKATKKQLTTVDDAVGKLFQQEALTDDQFEKLMRETGKSIQDAQKEKTENKK